MKKEGSPNSKRPEKERERETLSPNLISPIEYARSAVSVTSVETKERGDERRDEEQTREKKGTKEEES